MFVYVCFLVRYYYVECTDFMYDSIKILYIIILYSSSITNRAGFNTPRDYPYSLYKRR